MEVHQAFWPPASPPVAPNVEPEKTSEPGELICSTVLVTLKAEKVSVPMTPVKTIAVDR